MPRYQMDLCGLWQFQPDPADEGEEMGYPRPGYDDARWRPAPVPACFEDCHPGLEAYEGVGWFRRAVRVPADWEGRRVVLRFEGVNYHARVWVNGQPVGGHEDGFLPFEFPVHDLLNHGAENLVAVRADNLRRQGEVPGLQRGWRTYGGILREVTLLATDPLYLDRVTLFAAPGPEGGELSLQAEVHNERPDAVEALLRVRVTDRSGEVLAHPATQPLALQAAEAGTCALACRVAGARPWSPDDPVLYTARVELLCGGRVVDEQAIRFGFRRIEACQGQLYLNGQPIYLTGFSRHEDSSRRGMATDLETARQDLIEMKAAGANFVRLCHYPHHSGEIDLCDELGLLAMGEIPLYWWHGEQEGEDNCRRKLDAAKRQLEAMIHRDVNHPSLIFWSVGNESDETRPEVVSGNEELVRLARQLDPTRLAVHVSNHWQQAPHFEADDVLCVNVYPSLDRRGYGGEHAYDLTASTRFWRQNLQALHERYPAKPILVTEFGYVSLEGLYGNAFGEDLQAQAIEAEFGGMDAPYVCGATIWCWADHPWPASTFAFCRYLGISPYGVLTRERHKLLAYWTVQRIFRERQAR